MKSRVSFAKPTDVDRYAWIQTAGSGSGGRDLMRRRSNLGRASGIERPREVGRGAAAICRRRGGSRGGGLAGDAQTGAPGVNLTRAWVGWHPRGMRKPLEAKAWLGRA